MCGIPTSSHSVDKVVCCREAAIAPEEDLMGGVTSSGAVSIVWTGVAWSRTGRQTPMGKVVFCLPEGDFHYTSTMSIQDYHLEEGVHGKGTYIEN